MDVGSELKAVQTIEADEHGAGNVEGVAVDTKGFKDALVVFNCGAVKTGGTAAVHIEESDDGSTNWGDIAGAAFAGITSSNDIAMYQGRVRITPTRKRYLRAYAVIGTAAVSLAVSIILGDAQNLPAAEPAFDIHG
jgi:hypothetical protein